MICIGYACDSCKHQRENIDGWNCACDAFPDGIPSKWALYKTAEEMKVCNNGIGYEKKED